MKTVYQLILVLILVPHMLLAQSEPGTSFTDEPKREPEKQDEYFLKVYGHVLYGNTEDQTMDYFDISYGDSKDITTTNVNGYFRFTLKKKITNNLINFQPLNKEFKIVSPKNGKLQINVPSDNSGEFGPCYIRVINRQKELQTANREKLRRKQIDSLILIRKKVNELSSMDSSHRELVAELLLKVEENRKVIDSIKQLIIERQINDPSPQFIAYYESPKTSESDDSFNKPKGKVIGAVFANFHYDLMENRNTGVGLSRAYIGYNFSLNRYLSGIVTIDGKINDANNNFEPYFRYAKLSYRYNFFKVSGGLMLQNLYKNAYKSWYQYLKSPFYEEYKFAKPSNFGLEIEFYRILEWLNFDIAISNASETINFNDSLFSLKYSGGITFRILRELRFRIYADYASQKDTSSLVAKIIQKQTFSSEVIYNHDRGYLGALLFIYQKNYHFIRDYNIIGLSANIELPLHRMVSFVGRADYITSDKPEEIIDLDYVLEGFHFVTGFTFEPYKKFKLGLTFQQNNPENSTQQKSSMIFLSAYLGL